VPRVARSWLSNGFFHLTVRGNRGQVIFNTSGDARRMLRLIAEAAPLWHVKTYCLMPNHFHLVVAANVADLSKAMTRINGVYAQWFNRKYALKGHLFQGRFASKPIADEGHLFESIRYVLLNPVRAGLCAHPSEWPWCNWNELVDDPRIVALIDEALRV
jgi:putative transposase